MQIPLIIAGATLCAAAGIGLYADHLAERQSQTNALRAEAELSEGLSLPRSPSGTLRSLHTLISYAGTLKGAERACSLMTKPAQQQFAAAYGQPDCPAAARMLGAQVTNRNRYQRYQVPDSAEFVQGEQGSMDGCGITWRDFLDSADMPDPGPRLGMFTMTRVVGLGFKITGFEPCPAGHIPPATSVTSPASSSPASASSSASTPTTTPTTPSATGLLPSYAPAVPGILAARIAHGGSGRVTCSPTAAGPRSSPRTRPPTARPPWPACAPR
ncbi:hypothetical protein GCM10029964_093040 [Kibdelosporangium lantanae]